MNTQQPKSKWKTWHKITLAVIVLFIIGISIPKDKEEKIGEKKYQQTLTQAQEDSIALEKTLEDGKINAEVNLRTYVTKTLNDPKSFDILNKKTWIVGSTIIVMIDYTAKNGFGGVVRNSIRAEADSSGNLTKIFNN